MNSFRLSTSPAKFW